jgi:GT2 family glycosyltransferase
MRTELIVSTYEHPRALALSLASVARQRVLPDGIAIADDGSGPETAEVIAAFRAEHPTLPLRHVWHAHAGFGKPAMLNRAVASSDAEFLVFIDGDVMIHPGFMARHLAVARPDRFSTGSLIRLDAAASAAVTRDDVLSGRVFDRGWLRRKGALRRPGDWLKAMPFPAPVMGVLDGISPTRRSWCGANASAFRAAIVAVNGFDETFGWGGEDKEFGTRLANSGVTGQHVRYTTPLVHLWHPRPYAKKQRKQEQKRRIRALRRNGATWAAAGMVKP